MSEGKSLKRDVFDLFYGVNETTRSGGGKLKMKMGKLRPAMKDMENIAARVKETGDAKLLAYFEKLLNRPTDIAPPPRPN